MKNKTQQSYINRLKNYIKLIWIATSVFIIVFGFYAIELINRLHDIEDSTHFHNDKMISINQGLSQLNQAIGFGGYIHNFKNYVIRNEPNLLLEIEQDIVTFDTAITQLSASFTQDQAKQAIRVLQQTLTQYQLNMKKLKKASASGQLTILQKDRLVRIDDTAALNAVAYLQAQVTELNQAHIRQVHNAFKNTMFWLYSGGLILLFVIGFVIFLFKTINKLKLVYLDLAKALKQSDLLIANAPDAMISISKTGEIVRCNEQVYNLFGYEKAELLQQDISILLPQEHRSKHNQHVAKYFISPHRRMMGDTEQALFGQHKSGELIPIEVSLSSSVISGQRISTATIRDITLRVETENKLRVAVKLAEHNYTKLQQAQNSLNEKQMINIMLNKLPFCTLLLDDEAKVLLVNDTLLAETGYDKQQISELEFEQYVKISESKYLSVINDLKNKRQVHQDQNLTFLGTLVTKHDALIPIEINLSTYLYSNQVYTLLSFKNLTEVKAIEDKLIHSVERFTRVISAIEDGIWEWDLQTDTVNYSPQLMKIIGQEHELNPKFSHWFEHIHPDYKLTVEQALAKHLSTKEKYEVEYLGRNYEGEYNWFLSIGNSIYNEQNEPVVMSGSLRNIHHKKLLEVAFAEKSQFLTTIYQGASHAIWVVSVEANNQFRFIECNPTACRQMGLSAEQIKNSTITEVFNTLMHHQAQSSIIPNYINCVLHGEHQVYVESIRLSDETCWYKTSLYPIKNADAEVIKIVGTSIDITEQKRSESELAEHKAFLERIIDSAVCGLYVFDLQKGKNITINQRYTEILGYTMEELNQLSDFMHLFHPDDRSAVVEHMAEVANSKNGELFPLKYRFKNKKGHWVWCYSFDCIVKYDQVNEPSLMLGTFVDITELTVLMDQLQESNEYLERFAFVASHDLQEPLRKISAFSTSLQNRLQAEIKAEPVIEYEFSRLINASERMRKMIKELLQLSRINTSGLEIKPCSISKVVNQSIDLLSHLVEEHQVSFEVNADVCQLKGDDGLLIQLFQNLIANSIKFKSDDIKPLIKIDCHIQAEHVVITYRDNGIGIANKFVTQIFEPFRRLHSNDKYTGSGIGLAVCRQIANVHNGNITCSANVSPGAEFVITLPV